MAENATLDFETKAVYNLVVQASDNVGGQNTVKFVADAAVRYLCLVFISWGVYIDLNS